MAIQQTAPATTPAPVPAATPADYVAVSDQPHQNFRAVAVVGFVVAAVDILIAGRFLLKLLGASSQSSFVNLIYGVSGPLVAPFHGIFPNTGSTGNAFE